MNYMFHYSEMTTLQHSLVMLCDKANNKWQQVDPDVTMVTGSDGDHMNITQAVHHIAQRLKILKKVSH